MGHMTISGDRLAATPIRRPVRWPALLLPLLAAGVGGLFPGRLSWLVVMPAVAVAVLVPGLTARLTPYALLAYGTYGLFFARGLAWWQELAVSNGPVFRPQTIIQQSPSWGLPAFGVHQQTVIYGVLRVGPARNAGYVLPEAIVILVAATWLLAATGAPGGGAVRRALAQLRGVGGQPKTVPPLLLLPVILLSEELLGKRIWFDGLSLNIAGRVSSVVILAVGAALVAWLPRAAAAAAVPGTLALGLVGLLMSLRPALPADGPANWFTIVCYGPLTLYGRSYGGPFPGDGPYPAAAGHMLRIASQDGTLVLLLTATQGLALLVLGGLLAVRLPVVTGDAGLAGHTQALTQRVTQLTETRHHVTEAATAELRRIERDLHDGAQARLVAVGMSLRAAEQLMPTNPEAAMTLVAEARETSSRALDDLRDLVRGIYPPVLADRGLADALRALALDAPLAVHTEIALPAEPPMPVAAAAYFAVAEALANAARHSGAATVDIAVTHADGMLRATVTDDGHGGADPARGTGLAGMERRLATFDGILAVSSPPGGPTIIAIEIPYVSYPPTGGSLADVVRSSWQTKTLI
jgi:signal transduction histidine kinase